MKKTDRFIVTEKSKIGTFGEVTIVVDQLTGIEYLYSKGKAYDSDRFSPILNKAGLPRVNPDYDPDK